MLATAAAVALSLSVPCGIATAGVRCGPIDVVDGFGADPGGSSPSSGSLQAALDEAGACGGATVFVPAGRYLIEAPLRIGNGVGFAS